jgi:hypothetical protein
MEKLNLQSITEFLKKEKKFQDHVLDYAKDNLEIHYEMTERDHAFTDGMGSIVHEVNFKVKFKEGLILQPHADFDEELANDLFKGIVAEIEGYWDNVE